jgi:polysaccharide deacetylase family protein (PEP-CTERM system associated)
VDVEDYFMVEAFADSVSRDTWDNWPSRVVANTRRALDLFDRYNAKGTFFFVGWVAHKFPQLVRDVQTRGHELACHSFWHRTVYSLTPDEFRKDTRAAVQAIEDASGTRVSGYRAPSWSITKNCLWALDILAEEGFAYDSSIFPIRHDLYGVPGAQRFPYDIAGKNGRSLREFPPATVRFLGQNLPGAGGGYLRVFPMAYTNWVFRKFENKYHERVVVYVHPWEFDPEQPRIQEKLKSRVRHYTNLRRMEHRMAALLEKHKFQPFRELLDRVAGSESASDSVPVCLKSALTVTTGESVSSEVPLAATKKSSTGARRSTGSNPHSRVQKGSSALTYHAISLDRSSNAYTVSCGEFEEHLKLVTRLSKLDDGASKRILITFDDGHLSNFEYALPLLKKYSVRAMFFVVGGFIDARPDFMTWAQLREISAQGHEVGSHSWSHPLLTHCSNEALQEEISRSRQTIEQRLGTPVEALGVPGGRWDYRVLRAAADAGYRRVYVSDPWLATSEREGVKLIGRLTIRNSMQEAHLRALITGEGAYSTVFRTRYRAKELLRRAVGDGAYRRLWSLVSAGKTRPSGDLAKSPSPNPQWSKE